MAITLKNVSVVFGDKVALSGVSVHLPQRRIGVVGLNGSGKSTFARLLNGLIKPTDGTIEVNGINPATNERAARAQVGFIFSNPDLQIIMPTVAEDVAFSLRGRGLNAAQIDAQVAVALENFGLSALADQPAHSLSSGQKQMLALCAVTISKPAMIVADEPTALLDAANTAQIKRFLLQEWPGQVVLVTHDLALVETCDVLLRFDVGKLAEVGYPATVISNYKKSFA
jgi:biotin transport system ATP-binding protein